MGFALPRIMGEWWPKDSLWRGFFGLVALGILLALADALRRSLGAIRKYGFGLWFRSLFQVEVESLRTLGLVLLVLAAMIFVAIRRAG